MEKIYRRLIRVGTPTDALLPGESLRQDVHDLFSSKAVIRLCKRRVSCGDNFFLPRMNSLPNELILQEDLSSSEIGELIGKSERSKELQVCWSSI
jgi:hypothetical protein